MQLVLLLLLLLLLPLLLLAPPQLVRAVRLLTIELVLELALPLLRPWYNRCRSYPEYWYNQRSYPEYWYNQRNYPEYHDCCYRCCCYCYCCCWHRPNCCEQLGY